ncbi:hypothetical protein G7054_g11857 [Neopestalotiopsis clavispora]|nr:hypothetical protein G7054_g11857 [Neopestalotiopsis clavispora]
MDVLLYSLNASNGCTLVLPQRLQWMYSCTPSTPPGRHHRPRSSAQVSAGPPAIAAAHPELAQQLQQAQAQAPLVVGAPPPGPGPFHLHHPHIPQNDQQAPTAERRDHTIANTPHPNVLWYSLEHIDKAATIANTLHLDVLCTPLDVLRYSHIADTPHLASNVHHLVIDTGRMDIAFIAEWKYYSEYYRSAVAHNIDESLRISEQDVLCTRAACDCARGAGLPSYTDPSFDQILSHLIKAWVSVVRLGGRTRDEDMKVFNTLREAEESDLALLSVQHPATRKVHPSSSRCPISTVNDSAMDVDPRASAAH